MIMKLPLRSLFIVFLFIVFAMGQKSYAQDSLLTSLQKGYHAAKTSAERFGKLDMLLSYYYQFGPADSMLPVCRQLLVLAQQTEQDTFLMVAYNRLGSSIAYSDYSLALEYELKALKLAEQMQDNESLIAIYNNLCSVYEDVENWDEAMKYLRRAQPILPLVKENARWSTFIHWHLGNVFLGMGKPDSALYYTQMANSENLHDKDEFIQAHIFHLLATINDRLGQPALAESFYRQGIQFSDSFGMSEPMCLAAGKYSAMLNRQERFPLAVQIGRQGLDAAVSSGYQKQVIVMAGVLQESYQGLGRIDSAYYFSRLRDSFRTLIAGDQQLNKVQALTFAESIRQIEETDRLKAEAEQRKNNIQLTAIFIGLITFVILFLILSHRIVVHENVIRFLSAVMLLVVFELLNLLLHPIVASITNHSPVLMLLILVGAAALLVPAHHSLVHWTVKKLVAKNQKLKAKAAARLAKNPKEMGIPLPSSDKTPAE